MNDRQGCGSGYRSGARAARLWTELLDHADPALLEPLWLDLEARADASFFQSWGWIGCWLRCLPAEVRPRPLIVRAEDGRVVGLALLADRRTTRRAGLVRSRGCYLHETGDPGYDRIAIEYNGFLTDRRLTECVIRTSLARLLTDETWDELHLGGLDPRQTDVCRNAGEALRLRVLVGARKRRDEVDLEAVRRAGGGYLATLSRNARHQIRRSLRLYAAASGEMALDAARTTGEALAFLDRLKALHQAAWARRGREGAFAAPFFGRFHRALIAARFDAGEVQLLRLCAGGRRELGYLYNFVHRGVVHAYQSGFRYDRDPRLKPGLVSHSLAIERNLAEGARVYDFMAGASRYKASLGTHSGEMAWLVLQRDRLTFRIEAVMRAAVRTGWRRFTLKESYTEP